MIFRAWAIRSEPKRTAVRTTRQTVNVGMTSSLFGAGWRQSRLRSLSRSGRYCPGQNKNPARPNHTDFMACDYNIEIALRDANAFDGLGQEQCRQWHRIVRANTLRLVKPRRAPAFGPARHWRCAAGAFTPLLTKGMLTPPWNPSIRFPALTGGA